jgi:simple sugar transport system permease protein
VVNIGLEGIILFGALAAAVVARFAELPAITANPQAVVAYAPWLGLLAGAVVGGLVGLLHAVISIHFKADQVISGTAINLMAIGLPAVILTGLYDNSSNSEPHPQPPAGVGRRRVFVQPARLSGLLAGAESPSTFSSARPSVCGSARSASIPEAADSVGVNVRRMRYYGVVISGVWRGSAART